TTSEPSRPSFPEDRAAGVKGARRAQRDISATVGGARREAATAPFSDGGATSGNEGLSGSLGADLQDDFAAAAAGVEALLRRARRGKRQHALDERPQQPALEEAPHLLEARPIRAYEHAVDGEVAPVEEAKVAAQGQNGAHAAVHARGAHAREEVYAGGVEHGV